VTFDHLLFLAAGALAGGFVNGLAGFGTALFALGWWLQVLTPLQAVAVVLVMSVASGFQGLYLVRQAIAWRELPILLLPALAGIPIGLQILGYIGAEILKLTVACFLLLYGGFFIARRKLPRIARPAPAIDAAVGFLGGILGAVAGLSGALPAMWLAMRDWSKERSRGMLQSFNLAVLGLSAILLAIGGAYDRQTLLSLAVVLPLSLLAAQAGIAVFNSLTTQHFRRLLIALMLLSGAVLLLQGTALAQPAVTGDGSGQNLRRGDRAVDLDALLVAVEAAAGIEEGRDDALAGAMGAMGKGCDALHQREHAVQLLRARSGTGSGRGLDRGMMEQPVHRFEVKPARSKASLK